MIHECKPPTNLAELHCFLGLIAYRHRLIKYCFLRSASLTQLLHKDEPWLFSNDCQHAFDDLHKCLVEYPVLHLLDVSKSFYLQTDASRVAFGAVLEQREGKEHWVFAYASKPLTIGEQNYSMPELEAAAVHWALEHFKHYISNGQDIIIKTDQQCLHSFDKLNSLRT